MRRMLWMMLVLLLMIPAARADETWTETNDYGDTVTWTIMETKWGSITYWESDMGEDGLPGFRYHGVDFTQEDEFVAAFDAATGMQTFYLTEDWCYDLDDRDSFVALAEGLLTSGEMAFQYDRTNSRLLLLGIGEAAMPEGSVIHHAYIRQQRMFMTLDLAEGGHLLRIVTWRDGLDVTDIEVPYTGSFDTYHVGAQVDDYFILYLDTPNPDFGYIVVYEAADGRWLISDINTGWDVIAVEDWGIRSDVNAYWAYGACPWRDLAAMDWTTLPLTYMDAAEGMEHEGWFFAAEGAQLFSAMDESAAVLMDIPADTPLCLLKTEGDWAFVGVQFTAEQQELIWEADDDWYYSPWVGYVPVSLMNELPASVLPGGEIAGWFVTMQVEAITQSFYGYYTYTEYQLTFAPIEGYYGFMPIEVNEGFAEAALEAYRETGYAATPVEFAEALLPYLYDAPGDEIVRDAVLTESMLALCLHDEPPETWTLVLVTKQAGESRTWVNFRMPGPFRFSREQIGRWEYAIEFTGE